MSEGTTQDFGHEDRVRFVEASEDTPDEIDVLVGDTGFVVNRGDLFNMDGRVLVQFDENKTGRPGGERHWIPVEQLEPENGDGQSGAPDDDLEDKLELRLRGRKHDLIEVLNTLHAGLRSKTQEGDMTPPDHEMIHELVVDLHGEFKLEAANTAMQDRLQSGDVLVGESIDHELIPVHEDWDGDRDE